jgi:hypothetical protein
MHFSFGQPGFKKIGGQSDRFILFSECTRFIPDGEIKRGIISKSLRTLMGTGRRHT